MPGAEVKKKAGPTFQIIDGKTGQNLGILLNSNRLKPKEAAEKIEKHDPKLSLAFIETLKKSLPPREELEKINKLSMPEEDFVPSELFCKYVIF